MTKILSTNDPESVIAALVKRIELLERQNLLLFASIDSTPGLSVKVPDGISVPDGGSITIQAGEGLRLEPAGLIKVGSAGKIGQSGSRIGFTGDVSGTGDIKGGSITSTGRMDATGKISGGGDIAASGDVKGSSVTSTGRMDATGKISGGDDIAVSGYVKGSGATITGHVQGQSIAATGGITADGVVQGKAGVRTPWGNGTGLVKDIMEAVQSTANTALSNANSKPTVAYVDAAVAGARGRADDAYSLADGRVTQAQRVEIVGWLKSIATALEALDAQIYNYHAGKPPLPPFYKG